MVTDWKTVHSKQELKIMWKYAKISRLFTIGCIFLTEGTLLMQCAVGLKEPITYAFIQINNTSDWPLYMMGSFPYDVKVSPNYELTIFFQLLTNIFASISFSTSDSFFVILMLHLISQLSILKQSLLQIPTNINNINDKNKFLCQFSTIHKKYNQLWR